MTSTPAEPHLPQLKVIRDGSVMCRIFESAFAQPIHDCAVLNVRYKPGKSCLVSYRLTMSKPGTAAPGSQIVSARFYPPGGSVSRLQKAHRVALAAPAFGDPVFHVPDLDAVVWTFPNDRKLPGIPALTDHERIVREVVPRLMRSYSGPKIGAGRVTVEVIRYIPERGCTARVTVAPENCGPPRVFYGKTYSDHTGEHTYRNMSALWSGAARRSSTLQTAQPLEYEPAHLTLWQSAVEGPTLASLETSGPQFVSLLRVAGRAVATLHSEAVPDLERVSAADMLADIEEAAACLCRIPRLAGRASRIAADLLEQGQDLDSPSAATLHGDLHAKNVVSTGGHAALIDLDNLHAGDPLQDLGSFVASTCSRALASDIGASDIAPMVAALVGSYESAALWAVPRAALRWHTAAALIAEQAHRTVIRMKIGSLDALLDLAQQALSGTGILKVLS